MICLFPCYNSIEVGESMDKKKFELFKNKMNSRKYIVFSLYTATYIIRYRNEKFSIKLITSDYIHYYDSLSELFSEFTIYGDTLAELFNEIIIIE